MSQTRERVPAVEGWFRTDDAEPRLLGTKCAECATYFFPPETSFCRNPRCASTDLAEVPLSSRGTLWSYTDNRYAPPAPYVSPTQEFEPYAVAAVELAEEKMVVLGQVVPGVATDTLEVGMEMELVVDTLFEDDDREVLVWKWKPSQAG